MIDEWGRGAKYWDKAWNPVIGCRAVSEGCEHCYAARLAEQYPELRDDDGGFAPHHPKHLKNPPKSGIVFAGNMTDLFGNWNDGLMIRLWLQGLSPTATNLVLTKRAGRLRDLPDDLLAFDHVFYGVTAENQDRLIYRAGQIMLTGAKHKWISLEPLLEPVRLAPYLLTESAVSTISISRPRMTGSTPTNSIGWWSARRAARSAARASWNGCGKSSKTVKNGVVRCS